jgi:phosphopantothenoylcysteine decarboxylase/phosphopantothenate--cysteine ligase
VVAPATADFIGRAAHGLADDLLTACLLAARAKVLLVPAMNDRMWSHVQTERNVEQARSIGYEVLEPADGPLAVGEGSGPGRMPEPDEILSQIARVLEDHASLKGKSVLVTAGATREPIDPVRFISNHSSGKMGIAIARAAWRRGAQVTLIAGHVDVPIPTELTLIKVDSVEEMADAVAKALPASDVLFMAAAPADFRPAAPASAKVKKGGSVQPLALEPAADILRTTIARRKRGSVIVGFALETDNGEANARLKLDNKKLDLIVLNDATEPGAGFGVDTNRVTLLDSDGREETLPLMSKTDLADVLIDRVEEKLNGR